jgi:predicted TIM-barrel fold metal-dependent hydrolase
MAVAQDSVLFFLGNAKCITELVMGGMCARYPDLKFVSVESGYGYIPYLIEAMDWQFLNNRASVTRKDLLLPSEYFKRQIYATFWFESNLHRTIDLFQDNLMFESDFPHPTSLTPGPGSIATDAKTYIADKLAIVPAGIKRKILHDNAAKLYGLL